jgi:hypothetical protein
MTQTHTCWLWSQTCVLDAAWSLCCMPSFLRVILIPCKSSFSEPLSTTRLTWSTVALRVFPVLVASSTSCSGPVRAVVHFVLLLSRSLLISLDLFWYFLISCALFWSFLISLDPSRSLLFFFDLLWILVISLALSWSLLISLDPFWSLWLSFNLLSSLMVVGKRLILYNDLQKVDPMDGSTKAWFLTNADQA